MLPIIDSFSDGQKIVLNRSFFAQQDRQNDRDLHSHNCIEISLVLAGTADHILHFSDGRSDHQRLSQGNYMLLDHTVSHAYKNCSADFSVLNLLFRQSFLRPLADGEEALPEEGDFEELVKQTFPDFNYDGLEEGFVNRIYFDKDETVLSLARLCQNSSRGHYQEWPRTVRHALSLILVLSLQSLDRSCMQKKEGIIDKVKKYVDGHFAEDVTLTAICAKHFYSVPYVSHRFKEVCGCSFEQYVRQVRIQHAGKLLLSTSLSVGEIAERCGYTSPRSFRSAFSVVTGHSPLQFKKKYRNEN